MIQRTVLTIPSYLITRLSGCIAPRQTKRTASMTPCPPRAPLSPAHALDDQPHARHPAAPADIPSGAASVVASEAARAWGSAARSAAETAAASEARSAAVSGRSTGARVDVTLVVNTPIPHVKRRLYLGSGVGTIVGCIVSSVAGSTPALSSDVVPASEATHKTTCRRHLVLPVVQGREEGS